MIYGNKHIIKTKNFLHDDIQFVFDKLNVNTVFDMISLDEKIISNFLQSFDNIIYHNFVKNVLHFKELMNNVRAIQRLKLACENAKKSLSSSIITTINIDSFFDNSDLNFQLTRNKFEDICSFDFNRCIIPVEKALKDAKMTEKDINDVVLIGGSTRIPKIHSILNEKFPNKIRSNINPDEAVAYGAAVQAAILSGINDVKTDAIVLLDIIPLNLGIETAGGIMTTMIKRNSSIPCEKEELFSTFSDNQSNVIIKVFEGERSLTKDNNLLGIFELKGIPPMIKGKPKIKVTFKVDVNGIMTIIAFDESTKKTNNLIVENKKGRLSDNDIKQMIFESEQFAENDTLIKNKIEILHSLENYISSIKKTLDDESFKLKIGDDIYKSINFELINCLDWLMNNDDILTISELENKYKQIKCFISPYIDNYYNK